LAILAPWREKQDEEDISQRRKERREVAKMTGNQTEKMLGDLSALARETGRRRLLAKAQSTPPPLRLCVPSFSLPALSALDKFSSILYNPVKRTEKHNPFTRNNMPHLNTSFPPIRPFLRLNAPSAVCRPIPAPSFSPLFPTRLGFARAQMTPKSQLFGGFPLFLEIGTSSSLRALCALCGSLFRFPAAPPWAGVTELPLAPFASWREKKNPGKTATPCASLSQTREACPRARAECREMTATALMLWCGQPAAARHAKRDLTPLRTLRDLCESLFRFSAAPPWAAVTELPLAPFASWRENKHPGKTATPCAPLSQRREACPRARAEFREMTATALMLWCGEPAAARDANRHLTPLRTLCDLCESLFRFSAAPPWAAVTELPLASLASWRENKHPGKTATPSAPLSQRREACPRARAEFREMTATALMLWCGQRAAARDPNQDLTPLRVHPRSSAVHLPPWFLSCALRALCVLRGESPSFTRLSSISPCSERSKKLEFCATLHLFTRGPRDTAARPVWSGCQCAWSGALLNLRLKGVGDVWYVHTPAEDVGKNREEVTADQKIERDL